MDMTCVILNGNAFFFLQRKMFLFFFDRGVIDVAGFIPCP